MDTPRSVMQPKRISMGMVRQFISDHWRDYLFLFSIGGIIVAFDQWSKAWVRTNIPIGGDWLPAWLDWLMPFARIRHWHNSGAAFGFFQNGNLIFTILAIIVSSVIIYYFPRVSRRDWWLRLAMGIQLGGALGNLVDRVVFKRVTDFLSVGNFAVFNVADGSITVGVIILILGAWITERAAKNKAGTGSAPASGDADTPAEDQEQRLAARGEEDKGE